MSSINALHDEVVKLEMLLAALAYTQKLTAEKFSETVGLAKRLAKTRNKLLWNGDKIHFATQVVLHIKEEEKNFSTISEYEADWHAIIELTENIKALADQVRTEERGEANE